MRAAPIFLPCAQADPAAIFSSTILVPIACAAPHALPARRSSDAPVFPAPIFPAPLLQRSPTAPILCLAPLSITLRLALGHLPAPILQRRSSPPPPRCAGLTPCSGASCLASDAGACPSATVPRLPPPPCADARVNALPPPPPPAAAASHVLAHLPLTLALCPSASLSCSPSPLILRRRSRISSSSSSSSTRRANPLRRRVTLCPHALSSRLALPMMPALCPSASLSRLADPAVLRRRSSPRPRKPCSALLAPVHLALLLVLCLCASRSRAHAAPIFSTQLRRQSRLLTLPCWRSALTPSLCLHASPSNPLQRFAANTPSCAAATTATLRPCAVPSHSP
jgi:hypothetical protein